MSDHIKGVVQLISTHLDSDLTNFFLQTGHKPNRQRSSPVPTRGIQQIRSQNP